MMAGRERWRYQHCLKMYQHNLYVRERPQGPSWCQEEPSTRCQNLEGIKPIGPVNGTTCEGP
jgi:hypothetical protein